MITDKLTEFENHRTHPEAQNSLVVKNFVFQFLNNYCAQYHTYTLIYTYTWQRWREGGREVRREGLGLRAKYHKISHVAD